jgi:hypothetical protein
MLCSHSDKAHHERLSLQLDRKPTLPDFTTTGVCMQDAIREDSDTNLLTLSLPPSDMLKCNRSQPPSRWRSMSKAPIVLRSQQSSGCTRPGRHASGMKQWLSSLRITRTRSSLAEDMLLGPESNASPPRLTCNPLSTSILGARRRQSSVLSPHTTSLGSSHGDSDSNLSKDAYPALEGLSVNTFAQPSVTGTSPQQGQIDGRLCGVAHAVAEADEVDAKHMHPGCERQPVTDALSCPEASAASLTTSNTCVQEKRHVLFTVESAQHTTQEDSHPVNMDHLRDQGSHLQQQQSSTTLLSRPARSLHSFEASSMASTVQVRRLHLELDIEVSSWAEVGMQVLTRVSRPVACRHLAWAANIVTVWKVLCGCSS